MAGSLLAHCEDALVVAVFAQQQRGTERLDGTDGFLTEHREVLDFSEHILVQFGDERGIRVQCIA